MRRHYFVPLNGIQWLTLVLLLIVLGGFIYGFGQLHSTSASLARTQAQLVRTQERLAHAQAHQGDALRSVLCFAERTVRVRPGIPRAQRIEAERFYERALHRAHLPSCQG